jgi:3-hydroxyisobutyrate dehydrogenase-like beta-hydroxyacid dehydrogenase
MSPAMQQRFQKLLNGTRQGDPVASDVMAMTRLAMASAEQVGFSGWLGADAAKAFAMACEQGMTDMDDSQMLAFIRQAKKT